MATYNGSAVLYKRSRNDNQQNNIGDHMIAEEPRRKRPELPPNHVLLYTILNPRYPITTDVIHTISSPMGKVNRIVIFRKRAVQAMVEFENIDMAKRAKSTLDGADIYSGCCTLKIEFAKPQKLNVHRNDSDTWDYTTGRGADTRTPLLPQPARGSFGAVQGGQVSYGMEPYDEFGHTQQSLDQLGSGLMSVGSGNLPMDPGANLTQPGYLDPRTLAPGMSMGGGGLPPPIASTPVLMLYDLDPTKINCEKIFNLLCLYGNVVRVKFLKTKPGCAMVQMSDCYAVDRCMSNLNPTEMSDGHTLSIGYSKQLYLGDTGKPIIMNDGTDGFQDFSGNKNNRFGSHSAAMKNRIQPPSRILHFYNTPTNITEEEMINIFNNSLQTIRVVSLKIFPSKSGAEARSSSGLVEFATVPQALEALMTCNHLPIKMEGTQGAKHPYIMKLCFSSSRSINHSARNG